jgi:hypothetical protein
MTTLSVEAESWLREVLSINAGERVELTLLAGGGVGPVLPPGGGTRRIVRRS